MPAGLAADDDLIIYRSPDCRDYSGFDAPDQAADHLVLLDHCRAALDRRQRAYPALIARAEITAALAEADLAGWADLVQEWHWIVTGADKQPPHPLTLRRRLAAVDLALERIEAEMPRAGAAQRRDLLRQQTINLALRWHMTTLKFGAPAVHFWAGCNHLIRAGHAFPVAAPVCGTCERFTADPATNGCTRIDCGLRHKDAA